MVREAKERDEFRTPVSPEGLQVVQVTSDEKRDSEAYYLDCPSWTLDARLFVVQRGASDDGAQRSGCWLCDVEDGFALRPIVEYKAWEGFHNPREAEEASCGCVLHPAGKCAYHLIRRRDTVEAREVNLDTGRETAICAAPAPLRLRGSLSISADGERILLGCFLGNGKTEGAPWGAYIFHLRKGTYNIVEFGNGYRNMHCQYSHNPDPAFAHDILLNAHLPRFADGSWLTPPDGSWRWQDMPPERDDLGCAYTVVRDDGANWRIVPLGRAPGVRNGGHNNWRGRKYTVVSSCYQVSAERWRAPLLEATPVPLRCSSLSGPQVEMDEETWLGQRHPAGRCVDLTRRLARADACHFGFDLSGEHFVADTDGYATPQYSFLYIGTYVHPDGDDPYVKTRYLLLPRTSWKTQAAHPHPYLSPDGRYAIFQSDFTGRPQVYAAYGFAYP